MNASTPPKAAVLSLSGGMDSTSLMLHFLARGIAVYGLSFDYGQKHRLELDRLQANIEYLSSQGLAVQTEVLDVSRLGTLFHSALTNEDWEVPEGHYEQDNMKATVVPNRNAIFASVAYGYALSLAQRFDSQVQLGLGVHAGDHAIYPDCRPEFYKALHTAFQIGNWEADRVELVLPYVEWDKYKILLDAEASIEVLGLDFNTVFRNTCTSYLPNEDGTSNGLTGADVERILAFHQLGRPDPVSYSKSWGETVSDALRLEREYRTGNDE